MPFWSERILPGSSIAKVQLQYSSIVRPTIRTVHNNSNFVTSTRKSPQHLPAPIHPHPPLRQVPGKITENPLRKIQFPCLLKLESIIITFSLLSTSSQLHRRTLKQVSHVTQFWSKITRFEPATDLIQQRPSSRNNSDLSYLDAILYTFGSTTMGQWQYSSALFYCPLRFLNEMHPFDGDPQSLERLTVSELFPATTWTSPLYVFMIQTYKTLDETKAMKINENVWDKEQQQFQIVILFNQMPAKSSRILRA